MSKKKVQLIFIVCVVILGALLWFIKKEEQQQVVTEPKEIDVSKFAAELLTPNPTQSPMLSGDWQSIWQGIAIKGIEYAYNGKRYQLQVVKIDPKTAEFSLQYDKTGKTIQQWAQGQENSIIANAGFFKEENEPVGLLYIDGERIDNHRVAPANSGLLSIHEQFIEILNLATTSIPSESSLQHAVQTYPILIDQGKVVVSNTFVKQARRTAIALDAEKNVYLITANYPHLGLYNFAKVLHDSSLSLTKVLNLDGGGSTGIAIKSDQFQKIIDSESAVPTVIKISFPGNKN